MNKILSQIAEVKLNGYADLDRIASNCKHIPEHHHHQTANQNDQLINKHNIGIKMRMRLLKQKGIPYEIITYPGGTMIIKEL